MLGSHKRNVYARLPNEPALNSEYPLHRFLRTRYCSCHGSCFVFYTRLMAQALVALAVAPPRPPQPRQQHSVQRSEPC